MAGERGPHPIVCARTPESAHRSRYPSCPAASNGKPPTCLCPAIDECGRVGCRRVDACSGRRCCFDDELEAAAAPPPPATGAERSDGAREDARRPHAVVLERDLVDAGGPPGAAFDVERRGIPHYLQPHAFLPRGRRLLADWAPDVLDTLLDTGADPQDLALKLQGPREPGDEDLVYLWVRRPIIEWALRRAAAAEPAVESERASG